MQVGIDSFLYATPPPSGILSERGYIHWSGLAANAVAYYGTYIGRGGSFDEEGFARIAERLGMEPSTGGPPPEYQYLSGMTSALLAAGALCETGLVHPDATDVQGVSRLEDRVMRQLASPWHASLARYVVQQEDFETRRQYAKAIDRRTAVLMQLYTWYVALAPSVTMDIDRALVHGILREIMPKGWEKFAPQISSTYVRKLRQMIAIEGAIGSHARRVTGFIDRGLPTALIRNYLRSRGAKDMDPRPVKDSTDMAPVLTDAFGRYFYLEPFSPTVGDARLRQILASSVAFAGLAKNQRPVAHQLFTGLCTYLGSHDARWIETGVRPHQAEPPLWIRTTPDRKARFLEEARLAISGELDSSIARSLMMRESPEGFSITELRDRGLITDDVLDSIGYFTYMREPRGGLLSEASWRFWQGFYTNLYAVYNELFGPDAEVTPAAVRDFALLILDCPEDELPSISDMVWTLSEVRGAARTKGGVKLTPTPLPQVGSVRLASIRDISTPWQEALARFVLEQDAYEGAQERHAYVSLRTEKLLRVHDWYTSFVDVEALGFGIGIDANLLFGIVSRLDPEAWEAHPLREGMFYLKKLRQLIALERRLGKRGRLTGYTERYVPVRLIEEYVAICAEDDEDVATRQAEIAETLTDVFNRFYYLRRFMAPTSDLPEPRAMDRLGRMLTAMERLDEIPEGSIERFSTLFVGLHVYLVQNEQRWIDDRERVDPNIPAQRRAQRHGDVLMDEAAAPRKTQHEARAAEIRRQNVPRTIRAYRDIAHLDGPAFLEGLARLLADNVEAWILRPAPAASDAAAADADQTAAALAPAEPSPAELARTARAEAVAAQKEYKFVKPTHFSKDWEWGRGHLYSRDELIAAGLLTLRVSNIYYQMLLECVRETHLIDGLHTFMLNIYCAYRVLGGTIRDFNAALLEKIAIAFAHYGRDSVDYIAQGKKRAGQLHELLGLIAAASDRLGYDISVPFGVDPERRIPLVVHTEDSLADARQPPAGWREGEAGCMELTTLYRMGLMDPRTAARCREEIDRTASADVERNNQLHLLLMNVYAAYVSRIGISESLDRATLDALALSFSSTASAAVTNLSPEVLSQQARNALGWRTAQGDNLYPRFETAELQTRLPPAAIKEAEAIVAEEGQSATKSIRSARTLLNMYYHYISAGGSLRFLNRYLADAIIAQFTSLTDRNRQELIARHRARIDRIRQAVAFSMAGNFNPPLCTAVPPLVERWAAETHTTPHIARLDDDFTRRLIGWGIMEASSWVFANMLQDPDAHLARVVDGWVRRDVIPPEARDQIHEYIVQARSHLIGNGAIQAFVPREDTKPLPDGWAEGRAVPLDYYGLRDRGLMSEEAARRVGIFMDEEGVPRSKVRQKKARPLQHVIAVYFYRGGTLMIVDEDLLQEIVHSFATHARVPDLPGYERYLMRAVLRIFKGLRDSAVDSLTRPPDGASRFVVALEDSGPVASPFAALLAKAGFTSDRIAAIRGSAGPTPETTAVESPAVVNAPPEAPPTDEPEETPSPPPTPGVLMVQGALSETIPEGWLKHEALLSQRDLISLGLIRREVVGRIDQFVAAAQGVGRSERMMLQFILPNLVAAYAYRSNGIVGHPLDNARMAEVVDAFAAHGVTPSFSARRDEYLGLILLLLTNLLPSV
jgi:hypothetical protein